MHVANNKVITIVYTLTNAKGAIIDQANAEQPLVYLHGSGNIIPGLEQALAEKTKGDKVNVTIAPTDAYGDRQDHMVQTVSRSMFQGIEKIEPGMQFNAEGNTGPIVVTVTEIAGDDITIDGNHPLAGETLTFDVEITDVREPSADELSHGHVHGPGCKHD